MNVHVWFIYNHLPCKSNLNESIWLQGQQIKKEWVDVAETAKQNPTRKRQWRKPVCQKI